MLFGLFFGDWTLLVLIPALIFAAIAQASVKSTFKKYAKCRNTLGLTGAEVARRVLNAHGLYHVSVQSTPGELTDHYDPRENVIRLSESVYNSRGISALGVAAHEAGHACQHAEGYIPIKVRAAIIPITNIGSRLSMPLFFIGMLISGIGFYETGVWVENPIGTVLMLAGIIFFSFSTVFQLVTLPTEFNASHRALRTLESEAILTKEELPAARKTLAAAAMTYVAALAVSLASLLRLILIFMSRSGRRRD